MKLILVGCEESQAVTKAFRELGFEAYSCDLFNQSGGHPEWHIKADVLDVINGGVFQNEEGENVTIDKWDLGIFHPPCTYLSNAGARFLYPKGILNNERYKKGLQGKDLFMNLLNAPIDFICVENPVSSKIFELPKHSQEIQPYQFGHPFTKKTRLWIKGLPNLIHTTSLTEISSYLPSNTGGAKRGHKTQIKTVNPENTKLAGNWFNKGGKDRQKNRSKTFEGIAKAMAEQWGEFLNNKS